MSSSWGHWHPAVAVTVGLAVVLGLWAAEAQAHTRSVSYSTWTVGDGAGVVVVRVRSVEATALAGPEVLPDLVRLDGCRYRAPDGPGSASGVGAGAVKELRAPAGWHRFTWAVSCSRSPRQVESDLLFDALPAHLHFTSVGGQEHVLTAARRSADLGEPAVWAWAQLGAEHVVTGLDHLAFLLLLVLLSGTRRQVLGGITAFTVGHALALVGAALGYVAVDAAGAEVLIGASVLVFAVEAGSRSGPRRRLALVVAVAGGVGSLAACYWNPWAALCLAGMTAAAVGAAAREGRGWQWFAMVALFGLVHGLGFAEALRALGPEAVRPLPLALFNGGVELSQIALAVVAWPALRWLRSAPKASWAEPTLVGGCAALGMFWTATRLVGWLGG